MTSVTLFRDRGHTITVKKTTKSIIIKITPPSFLRTSLKNFARSLSKACISRYVLYIEISIALLFTYTTYIIYSLLSLHTFGLRKSCQLLDLSQARLAQILARFPRKAPRNPHESLANFLHLVKFPVVFLYLRTIFLNAFQKSLPKSCGPYWKVRPAKLTNRIVRTN